MIAALFYLQIHSARNRLIVRIKRLRQPKYLIGAIVGGLYFYFYFFRYLFRGVGGGKHAMNGMNGMIPPEYLPLAESLGALALFIIVLLAWLLPSDRAALTFTEAEVAFLFPAPMTRRQLINYKLVRSQLRIFFSALLLTLFSRRFGGNPLIHAVGWWLILSTMSLHFLGASFARTLLLDHGVSNRLRRTVVLALLIGSAIFIWQWAKKTLPAPAAADLDNFSSVMNYLKQLPDAGPALYLLFPFRLLVRPFLAPDAAVFFTALAPALLLFLLHYVWVVGSDVSFEDASLEASQKLAARTAAMRSGNWQAARQNQKAKRAWFKLSPAGPAATALLWKNLIGVGQIFSARLWIIFILLLVGCIAGFSSGGAAHFSKLPFAVIVALLAYSTLLGPQLLRADFRSDLRMADILKTFPLPGWQIALGEILAPVTVLASFQWLMILFGFGLIAFLPVKHEAVVVAVGISASYVLPALDFLLMLIPNAAVLLFPSWIQVGKDGPRGIEATGQRLVFALGQMLVLLVTLIPATLVFAVVYFPLKMVLGPIAPVPFASLAAAIVVAVEAGFGVMLLGKFFERFDVTEETSA